MPEQQSAGNPTVSRAGLSMLSILPSSQETGNQAFLPQQCLQQRMHARWYVSYFCHHMSRHTSIAKDGKPGNDVWGMGTSCAPGYGDAWGAVLMRLCPLPAGTRVAVVWLARRQGSVPRQERAREACATQRRRKVSEHEGARGCGAEGGRDGGGGGGLGALKYYILICTVPCRPVLPACLHVCLPVLR